MLYASGHETDDVLQDVFLRVHTALRAGVVPLEPRAWLLRLVHNACVDELRRARTRPVGDVELDGVPALSAQLPDELARRAEARALLGDIHRLPARQRSVLVMSAIDGLSHEEVAGPPRHDGRDDPLAAGAGAREPPPHRRGARDRLHCGLRGAGRGRRRRACGRARSRAGTCGAARTAAPTSATCARRRRACAGWRAGARGASSRSCSAAAGSRACRRSRRARAARSSSAAARSPCPSWPSMRATCRELASVQPELVLQEAARGPAQRTRAARAPVPLVAGCAATSAPVRAASRPPRRPRRRHEGQARREAPGAGPSRPRLALDDVRAPAGRIALRAFERGSQPDARPSAGTMQALLRAVPHAARRAAASARSRCPSCSAGGVPRPATVKPAPPRASSRPPRRRRPRRSRCRTPAPTPSPTPVATATPVPTATATPTPTAVADRDAARRHARRCRRTRGCGG